MDYIREIQSYHCDRPSAVTLDKFDGLHRGHQKLIQEICEKKDRFQVKTIVFAFDMNPFFQKKGLTRKGITTNEERRERLEKMVDVLVECPFDGRISTMTAEDFIEKILVQTFHVEYIVVGTDFRFGHEKKGDAAMLAAYAEKYGYELTVVSKEMFGDREISSTYIREELEKGNIENVNQMLGYPYTISGRVEHGKQLGRTLGFPTLNVHPSDEKMLPPKGVYMTNTIVDGQIYHGLGNVGFKPTVTEEHRMLIETFLFDYDENAYGKEVKTQLLHYKRPEKKFESVIELKAQIDTDIDYARNYFK